MKVKNIKMIAMTGFSHLVHYSQVILSALLPGFTRVRNESKGIITRRVQPKMHILWFVYTRLHETFHR